MYSKAKQYTYEYLDKFKHYKDGAWCYEDGIVLTGAECLYKVTNDKVYQDFILNYLDNAVSENGELPHYTIDEYNIDNINAGKVLFDAYNFTKDEKYKKAMDLLYSQLLTHPRTDSGNFWHKKRYPYQIWLDGIYMAQPYYARYKKEILNDTDYADILKHFQNVKKYLFDSNRNLYVHAYDEKHVMQWADKQTGKAPNVWSRAVGWYAMAIVDVLEIIENDDIHQELRAHLKELVDGMITYQADNGMWYQVVDAPTYEGNYLETSGTVMMAYGILKAVRLGYLGKEYLEAGKKAFDGTVEKYLFEDNTGLHLGGTCEVAGLDNEVRDGSIAYYLSEKVVCDEAKGVAPFMMCLSEVLQITNQ